MAAPDIDNPDVINVAVLEDVIGLPVSAYDNTALGWEEHRDKHVYQWWKPELWYVLSLLGDPSSVQLNQIVQRELRRNERVIAPALELGLFSDAAGNAVGDLQYARSNLAGFVRNWIQGVMGTELPKIVVQGGEAVNMYSIDKFKGVPTHDADCRILIPGMSYLTSITKNEVRMKWFHSYRFLAMTAIAGHVNDMLERPEVVTAFRTYIREKRVQLAEGNLRNETPVAFKAAFGTTRESLYSQLLRTNPNPQFHYALNQPYTERLVFSLNIRFSYTNPGQPKTLGELPLMDLKPPTPDTQLGHSPEIHSYFASGFARSHPSLPSVSPPGGVPCLLNTLTIQRRLSGSPTADVSVYVVPLGYILWDTLRMLLVQYQFNYTRIDASKQTSLRGKKYMKYKQKLWILLASLLDSTISEVAETKAGHSPIPSRLVGGEEPSESRDDTKALAFADEFAAGRPPPEPYASADELSGFLHYLSLQNPDYSDYRLPMPIKKTTASGNGSSGPGGDDQATVGRD